MWAFGTEQAPLGVEIEPGHGSCCRPPGLFPHVTSWTTRANWKQLLRVQCLPRQYQQASQLWRLEKQLVDHKRRPSPHKLPVQGEPELLRVGYGVDDGAELGVAAEVSR